jgi:single-stranded-DNA-specific exonuclease
MVERAGPFGAGHAEPVFALPAHRVAYADAVGKGHLRVTLAADGGAMVRAILFRGVGSELGQAIAARRGAAIHVAGTLSIDHWQGSSRLSLRVLDAAVPG